MKLSKFVGRRARLSDQPAFDKIAAAFSVGVEEGAKQWNQELRQARDAGEAMEMPARAQPNHRPVKRSAP